MHKDGDRYHYFSPSSNATLLERPRLVESNADRDDILDDLTSMDLSLKSMLMYPNTEWRLHALTSLIFYFTKLKGVGRMGDRGAQLLWHMHYSNVVIGLMKDPKMGTLYADHMCAFRCLALMEICWCGENECSCKRASERLVMKLHAAY